MRTTSRIRSSLAALLLGGGAFPVGEALAQTEGASIELFVQSAEDLRPLAGARVSVQGLSLPSMTDENGYLHVTGVPGGSRAIEVRYLGYRTATEVHFFEPGRSTRVEVRLQIAPIELAEVRVRTRSDILLTRGFYDRQRGGLGTFLTRADITRTDPRYLSDLLRRVSGIRVGPGSPRPSASIRGGGGRTCPIQYFVDGTLTSNFNIDEVQAADVEGLEIYRGASSVPPMYNKGTASCGVILIWTRID